MELNMARGIGCHYNLTVCILWSQFRTLQKWRAFIVSVENLNEFFRD